MVFGTINKATADVGRSFVRDFAREKFGIERGDFGFGNGKFVRAFGVIYVSDGGVVISGLFKKAVGGGEIREGFKKVGTVLAEVGRDEIELCGVVEEGGVSIKRVA